LLAVSRHRLFALAFGLGVVLRAITMVGFQPAIWFGGDSASYLSSALRLAPGTSRLSGYGLMLRLLRPFHSFAVVVAVQHLLGLAMAVLIYLLLRRYRLPAWGATLAAAPVLLSAYQIQLEHEILPSATFGFLVLLAITLTLWWRGRRPLWATVAAGLALAAAATFWPVGLPMLILFLAYLVLRRAGWRAVTATAAAAALPLAGYLMWFNSTYHHTAFTYSDGIYLWSRTMTFANCAVIEPPASERPLCPDQPPGQRPAASSFIWEDDSPLNRVPGKKFSVSKNALALSFARRAIVAQPLDYLGAVAHDGALAFSWNIPDHPSVQMTWRYEFAYATQSWDSPSQTVVGRHTVTSDRLAYGGQASTRAVGPFAGWMRGYQRFVYLRGTLLGVLLLAGLAGIARFGRRGEIRRLDGWGGPGLYPWLASAALLLVPVMTADYSERYVLIAVPVACLAAALAFAGPGPVTGGEPAAAGPATAQETATITGTPASPEAPASPESPGSAGPAAPAGSPAGAPAGGQGDRTG